MYNIIYAYIEPAHGRFSHGIRFTLQLQMSILSLSGGLCQGGVVEQPLCCFMSSPDCSVNETIVFHTVSVVHPEQSTS